MFHNVLQYQVEVLSVAQSYTELRGVSRHSIKCFYTVPSEEVLQNLIHYYIEVISVIQCYTDFMQCHTVYLGIKCFYTVMSEEVLYNVVQAAQR